MIIAFLSLMKPCPKLHHNVPLNAIRFCCSSSMSVCCHSQRRPAPGRPHLISSALLPGLAEHIGSLFKFLWNQFICHSFPCKPPKGHASSRCFIVSFSAFLLLWGASLTFSSFPSVSFSCSSTCRSVAWVCHEDEFIPEEKCAPFKEGV